MLINTFRFILRDFLETDRAAFISYQMDPRYRRLYDFAGSDDQRAQELFDLFINWQKKNPRENFQIGIFERSDGHLCGTAGLRRAQRDEGTAAFGIELAPEEWGRYRLAIEVASALLEYGFFNLNLHTIVGDTASGNRRVEKLARWFGASSVGQRAGADWMVARGWQEIAWVLTRDNWAMSEQRRIMLASQTRTFGRHEKKSS